MQKMHVSVRNSNISKIQYRITHQNPAFFRFKCKKKKVLKNEFDCQNKYYECFILDVKI